MGKYVLKSQPVKAMIWNGNYNKSVYNFLKEIKYELNEDKDELVIDKIGLIPKGHVIVIDALGFVDTFTQHIFDQLYRKNY